MEAQYITGVQQVMFVTPWMVSLAIFCARWLILANVFVAVFFLLSSDPKDRHTAFEAAWSLVLALILTSLLAHFVGRDRPFVANLDIRLLIPPPFNTSFPSGHTASAVAVALTFLWRNRLVGLTSLVLATFVAFGRVLVGVHYPTDLLGGMCIGVISFGIVRLFHAELVRRDIARSAAHHIHDT